VRIRLLTVGKPRDPRLVTLTEEYLSRLPGWQWQWDWIKDEAHGDDAVERTLRDEKERLTSRIKPDDYLVLLDVEGQTVTSPQLAERLAKWLQAGRRVTFLVGGSYGVHSDLQRRADWRWSLSRLTFPHALVPLLVSEQIYRAWTIMKGHPYHKA
jgi:23S rRNA (pseudouridine1915-N3)-methyltransferase